MKFNQCIVLCVLVTLSNSLVFSHEYDFDLVVIGAGASGMTAASLASRQGYKVALIEKGKIGGGRIWSGDIPFKVLFKKADIIGQAQKLPEFEGSASGWLSDSSKILENVRSSRQKVYDLVLQDLLNHGGIEIIYGSPRFVDSHTLIVNQKQISSQYIIIATGSSPKIIEIDGIDEVNYLTRANIFDLKELPKSMVIVGGGPLGVEMASSLNKLGVKVSLVMKHGLLLPTYDFELVQMLTDELMKEGINIYCDMKAYRVAQQEDEVIVYARDRIGKDHKISGEQIFFATGSKPNLDGLELESAGIKYDQKGIPVNKTLQTSVPHIYAVGDVVGLNILSRVAYYHAKGAVFNMFKKSDMRVLEANYIHVAKVVFTVPEFASAGLPEQEARKLYGNQIKIYKCTYESIEKSYIDHDTTGIAKFICDMEGNLIGVHIFGNQAGYIVDTVQIGEKLAEFYFEHTKKIRTSPSYFDILIKIAGLYREDFTGEVKISKVGYLERIWNLFQKYTGRMSRYLVKKDRNAL